mmetsp:Transcript_21947/g.48528  ORF Transcript_21947/g.48528 Transcript_21947/m.48528 type:complete len:271 (-) Transcript_21947:2639-3451(-)
MSTTDALSATLGARRTDGTGLVLPLAILAATPVGRAHLSVAPSVALRHAIVGPLDVLLEALVLVGIIDCVFLRPLNCGRSGATKTADHVRCGGVSTGQLCELKPSRQADIAFVELQALLKVQGVDKFRPAPVCHCRHSLNDDVDSLKAGVSDHVSIDGIVASAELGDEHVQQEDERREEEREDQDQNQRLLLEGLVVFRAVHPHEHPEEGEATFMETLKVRIIGSEAAHRGAEHEDGYEEGQEEERHLRHHSAADEHKSRDARVHHRQIH